MLTGTDINIYVCRSEGYPVVQHGKSPLDIDKSYRLTISNIYNWTNSGTVKFNRKSAIYNVDTLISYSELWRIFESCGKGIKDFCDFENCPNISPSDNPSYNDFVNLASTIYYYNNTLL